MTPQEKKQNQHSEKNEDIKTRETRIDHELEETFPASDPPSFAQPGNAYNNPKKSREQEQRIEERIDEELDQSFPASDPPSYSKPGNTYDKSKPEK